MNSSEVRAVWLQRQADVLRRAYENKASGDAPVAMAALYRSLPVEQRRIIDELLGDQLASQDEDIRFLAQSVIADFNIKSALPALRRLASWLEGGAWPGAPYEWSSVNRIIAALTTSSDELD